MQKKIVLMALLCALVGVSGIEAMDGTLQQQNPKGFWGKLKSVLPSKRKTSSQSVPQATPQQTPSRLSIKNLFKKSPQTSPQSPASGSADQALLSSGSITDASQQASGPAVAALASPRSMSPADNSESHASIGISPMRPLVLVPARALSASPTGEGKISNESSEFSLEELPFPRGGLSPKMSPVPGDGAAVNDESLPEGGAGFVIAPVIPPASPRLRARSASADAAPASASVAQPSVGVNEDTDALVDVALNEPDDHASTLVPAVVSDNNNASADGDDKVKQEDNTAAASPQDPAASPLLAAQGVPAPVAASLRSRLAHFPLDKTLVGTAAGSWVIALLMFCCDNDLREYILHQAKKIFKKNAKETGLLPYLTPREKKALRVKAIITATLAALGTAAAAGYGVRAGMRHFAK